MYKSVCDITIIVKFIRLNPECCIQAWWHYIQKSESSGMGSKAGHKMDPMFPSLREKEHEEWLQCLKLTTLETRRLRRDMIEVLKILKVLNK